MTNQTVNKNGYWNGEVFRHTLAHLAGTLAPFIIVFIVCIFTPSGSLWEFLKEGDFCLFTAAILTPAAYTFASYKPKKVTPTSSKEEVFAKNMWVVSIFLIGVSSILFTLIYIHSLNNDFKIYANLIVVTSIFFLIISFFLYYASRYLHREIDFDINNIKENDYNDFESDYNKLID